MSIQKLAFKNKAAIGALAVFLAGSISFTVGNAFANPYGTEITIYDGVGTNGIGTIHEDNEAEPGMVQSQSWDLEGFFLNGSQLTIVGGYNFYTGNLDLMAGDIFIDTNGDAIYSPNTIPGFDYDPGYMEVSNELFRYDYVLDVDWVTGVYDIIALDDNSILKDTEYGDEYNKPSNPWRYVSGGDKAYTGSITDYGRNSLSDTGFSGWGSNHNHYAATFDLSPIDLSNGALFHNTMECGNDNLMGQVAPVPEPATMLLFGTGLAGLAGMARRRRRQI